MVINQVRSREKGQILVVLVLALIGLLAFTALAIDVGMTFSDRRYDQNVADAAALSAADLVAQAMKAQYPGEDAVNLITMSCPNNTWSGPNSWSGAPDFLMYGRPISWVHVTNAAIGRAYTNNVVIDKDISDGNGVSLRCVQNSSSDKYIEVKVMVSSVTKTSFAHFVFGGALRNTVTAIAKVTAKKPLTLGNSILALDWNCQGNEGGMEFDGGVIVNSYNGGKITTNQCMETHAGSATVNVFTGNEYNLSQCAPDAINYYDPKILPINAEMCPGPEQIFEHVPTVHSPAPVPDCRTIYTTTQNGSNLDNTGTACDPNNPKGPTCKTIKPGLWNNITVTSTGFNLTLEPGLYCITGGFKFTGGSITTTPGGSNCESESGGCGVTFYILDGDFSLAGNGAMTLSAPMSEGNITKNSIPFLLIGAPDDYYGAVDIEGTADDVFNGAIIVPGADLIIGGNSTLNDPASTSAGPTFTSLVGNKVKFHGDTAVNVRYDVNKDIMGSTYLEMEK